MKKYIKIFAKDSNAELLNGIILSFLLGLIVGYYQWFIGIVLFFVGVVVITSKYMLDRETAVGNMIRILEKINSGQSHKDLKLSDKDQNVLLYDQLKRNAISMEGYRQEISGQKESMKAMMRDVSLQLANPIIILQKQEATFMSESSESISFQIQKIKKLTDSLVRLADFESELQTFDIKIQVVTPILDRALLTMASKLNHLDVLQDSKNCAASFDFEHSVEVLLNVLENKSRYAKNRINIEMQENPRSVYVKVSDDGEALTGELRHRLFDRFYTQNSTRSESVGVGLAIAKEIMRQQGGDLTLEGDNTFVIRFCKVFAPKGE